MPTDDDLMADLESVLTPPHREPPGDRIAALRVEVERRRGTGEAVSVPVEISAVRERRAGRAVRRVLVGLTATAAVFVGGFVTSEIVRTSTETTPSGRREGGLTEFAGRLEAPASGRAVGTAIVTKTGIGRVVELRSKTLSILPKGEFYEVWFVGPGDSNSSPNRISAGTFHPDEQGRTDVTFAAAVDPAKFPMLEITAEPASGDPAPEGDVVLRADISR